MRTLIWSLVVVLAVLHQDVWFWDDATLVGGVMPVGLFYHVMFSLAAAVVWALAVKWAWPDHIEQWADEAGSSGSRAVSARSDAEARDPEAAT